MQGSPPLARGTAICKGFFKTFLGSPPLARGTVITNMSEYKITGITPACAGNRAARRGAAYKSQDHPRLRGEQYAGVENAGKWMGSPPLARGTVTGFKNLSFLFRITPACAGNSCFKSTLHIMS